MQTIAFVISPVGNPPHIKVLNYSKLVKIHRLQTELCPHVHTMVKL